MARTKISEFSATPASNTDIDSIFIGEGMAPSNVNDAIRELMAQLKDWQSGTSNDPYVIGSSGSLTLNQGTANGVTYLNGSKVVTSGSALTFDGTNFATTGNIRSSGANGNIGATGTTGNATLALQTNARLWTIGTSNSDSALYWRDETASAEQMRLTSTGLGIGTSSPYTKLDVTQATAGYGGWKYALGANATDFPALRFLATTGNTGNIIAHEAGSLVFLNGTTATTAGSERMRLDSSGNLGLGVTPSAWNGIYKVIQTDVGSIYSSSSYNNVGVGANVFYNASNSPRYIRSDYATLYGQDDGLHAWYTAPSGTAGNAITFTQALTLDASGNMQLGTTSNIGTSKVSIYSSDLATAYNGISVKNGANSTGGYFAAFYNYLGNLAGSISQSSATTVLYNVSSDYRLKNITGPITTSGAYIDSLNPVEGTWKADGSTFVGLIAHEVQEASRTQVATGTKDGAEMQAMDYSNSELIANLIAEVKSLRQRVATLEAK